MAHNAVGINFRDAIACCFSASQKLIVIYGDHNLYIWDVHDLSKITRGCAYFSHDACRWDISNLLPNQKLETRNSLDGTCRGSFVTCSADGTIRLWDLALGTDKQEIQHESLALDSNSANVYCKDTPGVIYSEKTSDPIKKQFESEESVYRDKGFRSLAVSGDSCIFIWKLSAIISKTMRNKYSLSVISYSANACFLGTTIRGWFRPRCAS